MKISSFHHAALKTTDMERSIRFYTALGAKEKCHFTMPSGITIYMMALSEESVIELIPGELGDEAEARWFHMAFRTDDCDAAFAAAIAAGATVKEYPCDKQLGDMTARLGFVYGPDREVLEFFQEK